jgi:hypothetical protein
MKFKRRKILGILAVLTVVVSLLMGSLPVLADGGDPSPYATEVVDSSGPFGGSPYDDPESVLGKPSTQCKNAFGGNPTFRVKLVEPAYNVDLDDEKVITTINSGAYITVRFDHPVMNDPDNPYGIDLLVFGNSMFSGTGGFVSDDTDMDTYMLANPASCFSEPVTVAVSQDGSTWHEFSGGPFADSMFPTQAYEWDSDTHSWTDNEMDFTRPVDPSITLSDFDGISAAAAIALYDGSGGGTGYDLDEVGLDWIQYVKVISSGGEIDAFADVAPVGDPAITIDLRATGIAGDVFNATNFVVPDDMVVEDGFVIDTQTAMGALVYYCQQNSIEVTVQEGEWGLYVYQIGTDVNDENNWTYTVDESTPWVSGDQYALSGGESVHWANWMLGLYSLHLSVDPTSIEPGESITATVTYTNGDGTSVPAEAADVYVTDTTDEWGNPVPPGVDVGQTNASGERTFTWNDEGTFYPYAEWEGKDTIYQWPVVSFTCSSTPAWDVNGDGIIDVFDMILVGNHFGETGSAGWIPEDVNADGVIDVFDMIVIGNHFGE